MQISIGSRSNLALWKGEVRAAACPVGMGGSRAESSEGGHARASQGSFWAVRGVA